jgi:type I restriction enzyme R subunit
MDTLRVDICYRPLRIAWVIKSGDFEAFRQAVKLSYTLWGGFLNFLIPKLPAPKEEDLSKGVLESIDMDSYRVEAQAALKMAMDDADATVEPVPAGGGGFKPEPEIDKLSNIVREFNDLFCNIEWKDEDKILKVITEEIPARVAQDKAYQNAQANSDKQNAKLEHDRALNRVVLELLSDHTELFKQFSDNPNFKRWLTDMVFDATYHPGAMPPKAPPQIGV